MTNLIFLIVANSILAVVIWYSENKSNKKLRKEISGRYILKANLTYKVLGIIFVIISILLTYAMILNWNQEIQFIAPFGVLLFFIPGVLMMMYYYNYSVEFNESRIIITNWKGTEKIIRWNDIIKIKFINSIKYLYIKSNSGKTLINQDCVGFITLIEMTALKTDSK